jgi:hypothetical protein
LPEFSLVRASNFPNDARLDLRFGSALFEKNAEIGHVERIARRIEFYRNRTLQAVAFNLRSGPASFFVGRENFRDAVLNIHAHHFEADRVQNFSDISALVAEERYERLANVAEFFAP